MTLIQLVEFYSYVYQYALGYYLTALIVDM